MIMKSPLFIRPFLYAVVLWIPLGSLAGAEGKDQPTELSSDRITVTFKQDGKDIQILLLEGKVKVIQDGTTLSEERVASTSDYVTITSENGSPLAVVDFSPDVARFNNPEQALRKKIGVRLQQLDVALATQLKLEPDEALLVIDVKVGQPAAEAGIMKFDILTSIGDGPATQERLKTELFGLEDGEDLSVRVVRKGEARTFILRPRLIDDEKKNLPFFEWMYDLENGPRFALKSVPTILKPDLKIDAYTDLLVKILDRNREAPKNQMPDDKVAYVLSMASGDASAEPDSSRVLKQLRGDLRDVRALLEKMEKALRSLE